jgi:hypothetical protein
MDNAPKNLWIAIFLTIALTSGLPLQAAPTPVSQTFTEVGQDVTAAWQIRDQATNAQGGLPKAVTVFLCEDDLFFDDLLGATSVTVPVIGPPPNNSVPSGSSGGYLSPVITFTFVGASNKATGFGDDYYLTTNGADCSNRKRRRGEYEEDERAGAGE